MSTKSQNTWMILKTFCILTYILFVCLFIRSLVALYMGRWNLF